MTGARLPAKLLLFGEHSILAGSRAIGLPYPRFSDISVDFSSQAPAPLFWLNETALDKESAQYQELVQLWQTACAASGKLEGWNAAEIRIRSRAPLAAGFGSSAVLCSLFTSVLLGPETARFDELWQFANKLEIRFHNTPSGIDTGTVLAAKTSLFVNDRNHLPLKRSDIVDPGLPLVVGAVPRTGTASALIRSLQDPSRSRAMQALVVLVEEAIEFLLSSGPWQRASSQEKVQLGKFLNGVHTLLCYLGLGNEDQNSLLQRGLELGALGGKLSGAGAGGAYLLLARDGQHARELVAKLGAWAKSKRIATTLAPEYIGELAGENCSNSLDSKRYP